MSAAAGAADMRAFAALAASALAIAGCETAFVGRAPGGLYRLTEVEGRPLPFARSDAGCDRRIESGAFELDALARRYRLTLSERNSCSSGGLQEFNESGSYLRSGSRLTLESAGGGTRIASASPDTVRLDYGGLDLRFRQARPD